MLDLVSDDVIMLIPNHNAGEWWKSDVETVINQAMQLGMAPNVSDAHTINGHPGPAPNCSSKGTHLLNNFCCLPRSQQL